MPLVTTKAEINLPEPPANDERLLYVVLHGLVALVETPDEIRAIMIRMSDEHTYLAGSWLAERLVKRGSHGFLSGVKGVTNGPGLNPRHNPLLRIDRMPTLADPDVHACLSMPRPRNIHYLDRGKIRITGGAVDRLVDVPDTLSAVRVLEYDIETEFSAVFVGGMGLRWTADKKFTTFDNGARVATLHIFDMPAGPVSDTHHVDEFAISSRVLGAPLIIDAAVEIAQNSAPPPGIPEFELFDFTERENEISDVFTDWLRAGRWKPRGAIGGTCRPCCGSSDGRTTS